MRICALLLAYSIKTHIPTLDSHTYIISFERIIHILLYKYIGNARHEYTYYIVYRIV